MKIKNIFLACGMMVLGSIALTSCGDDEETYDFPGIDYERLYMQNPNTTTKGSALKNPAGLTVSFKGQVAITTTGKCENPMSATIGVDPSLVADYNASNSTSYEAIPDGVAALSKDKLTIPAGELTSDSLDVTILEEGCDKLRNGVDYLIPVTMLESTTTDARVAKEKRYQTRYFVLSYKETNSLLLTEGDKDNLIGSASGQASSWTCIDAKNLDPTGYSGLFTGQWGGQWDFQDKNASETYFTVDLGATHQIGGFSVGCYVSKYYSFEISTDGSTWTSLGDTQEAKGIYDASWNQWYGLLVGMSARYVKVNIVLDPDNWGWDYADWGYASLSSFDLLFND